MLLGVTVGVVMGMACTMILYLGTSVQRHGTFSVRCVLILSCGCGHAGCIGGCISGCTLMIVLMPVSVFCFFLVVVLAVELVIVSVVALMVV